MTGGLFGLSFTSFYAYTFFFGSLLRSYEIENSGLINLSGKAKSIYSGGVIISIVFMMVIGIMRLSGIPNFQKFVNEAKVAARLAYNVIDHVPDVDPNVKGKEVDKKSIKGEYVFENVCFSYPSNKSEQVLNNFSCTFEAGKTTALVG